MGWFSREIESLYPVVLTLAALVVAVGPDLQSRLVRASITKDGFSVELREIGEGQAAADAAEHRTSADVLRRQLDSHDDGDPTPWSDDPTVIGALNYNAGTLALHAIFEVATTETALKGCDIRLYMFDVDLDELVPIWADEDEPSTWPSGVGATGEAWRTGKYVLATGSAVRDATYDLTPDQQSRYSALHAVAAMPVCTSTGTVIGVVTAATRDPKSELVTSEGRIDLTTCSLLVSRVIIELFQWFSDDE